MKTLADAWQWYQDAKVSFIRIHRLGEKHWLNFSPEANASLRRDDRFRMLEPQDITAPAQYALDELDDLAIVL